MNAIETLIIPRTRDLGDGFEVRRALPAAGRRMVGPFVFLDQMGPTILKPGIGLDVRPHPHIGLATVTWLMEGEILHRDSLGTVQPIRAGEVNWMTAGRGIVHSERSDHAERAALSSLYGLQCWVDALPVAEGEGAQLTMVAGSFLGLHSPLPTRSPLVYAQIRLAAGARLDIPAEYEEQALYLVSGELDLADDGVFGAGQLLVLKPHQPLTLKAGPAGAALMMLGGEPMEGPRHLVWNFVSSREERIEQAKRDWIHQRFAPVPEETEWIPLPDNLRPVDYP